jgi:hypothetical protein
MNRKSSPLLVVARKRKKVAKATLAPVPATTYRMTLNDGAIEWARREYRGYTVKDCHSGMTAREAQDERDAAFHDPKRSKLAVEGLVWHDVPTHSPYGKNEVVADTPTRKRVDTTISMFGEDVGVGGKLAD